MEGVGRVAHEFRGSNAGQEPHPERSADRLVCFGPWLTPQCKSVGAPWHKTPLNARHLHDPLPGSLFAARGAQGVPICTKQTIIIIIIMYFPQHPELGFAVA